MIHNDSADPDCTQCVFSEKPFLCIYLLQTSVESFFSPRKTVRRVPVSLVTSQKRLLFAQISNKKRKTDQLLKHYLIKTI